ncbi:MAG: ferritin family protein [Gammaproteobacteria bacterium]|nr:ferritin family protein [Gammaproteobacteria bacterium]
MSQTLELLKQAIQAEVRSELFYTKAADQTEDDEARMVFIELAGIEDGHARHLVERFSQGATATDVDLHAFLRESEAAGESLLTVEETPLLTEGNMEEVLNFAIAQELKARDNYQQLLHRLSDSEEQKLCQALITEEQNHANRLEQLINSLEMDEDERPAM